ncbi:DUF262 domain-containing protein [Pelagicoccus sp. SDUM812002]|uniref:DUF262 domain-containing protein n=1 Tax=Pelagicoccus sp. SDUM812002 TaxID=3041266 RepID=UPI00280ECDF8|nr:DUF262 domain-containing protein [Pelagicoccus sp. SDUM812002]MDQ8186808.1 DUF262 domain-containing protein [Pelagicoccus sp. SDUM812002]
MDISPDKQNIDRVFSNTAYYIDFYQRDYRWTDEPVLRLLDDIFFKFKEQYARTSDRDPSMETITAHYPWYYLNTYVTNVVNGRTYIVDGQQRLTTLSLILVKLRHLAKQHQSELQGWIETKIGGQQGFERHFWMNHIGHKAAQQGLFDGKDAKEIDISSGITAANMVSNYGIISAFIDKVLREKHIFETFVFYFLYRLVLINLEVEQTDVSMVFEVINDRGVKLRPYEILKGKLLGQIDKIELDKDRYNELWEKQASAINSFKEDELDVFFRFYLKAKYANKRSEGAKFDGDYHRAMFSFDMDEKLELLHNPAKVKAFLKGEFTYYSNLFIKLRAAYGCDQQNLRGVYYNYLLDLDAPFLLAIAACSKDDPREDEKIRIVTGEADRYFSLLQLQNAYDSNEFADSLFRIATAIRETDPETYRAAFDAELIAAIAARRNVSEAEPLSYAAFKQTGINLNTRFKRYFFARIDEFLAMHMNLNAKHPIADLVTKTGAKTGFHVEHILSWNTENKALFDNDEERFEQERNRLGGILLLKGKDNISSNNEPYSEKLKSYANTLYWNETLREDSYKSKLDLKALKSTFGLDLVHLEAFGPNELEARHKLLFQLIGIIWK